MERRSAISHGNDVEPFLTSVSDNGGFPSIAFANIALVEALFASRLLMTRRKFAGEKKAPSGDRTRNLEITSGVRVSRSKPN